jgi:hypothetical protein
VTHVLPAELTDFGRSDNMGFARGNLMADGELYLVGATSGTSISRFKFTDGEIDTDDSYLANCDGVAPNSGIVLNYYTDLNGNDAVLYVNRSNSLKKLAFTGDDFTATDISLPSKGNCNGTFPLVWDGKELMVYPTLGNYHDGFAVAEINAAEPLARVEQTVTTDLNSYQANWLNAEVVDSRNVTIYQYYPGGHLTVWRLTKRGGYLRGDVDDNGVVNITDVTLLINYLLNSDVTINYPNADCDSNSSINITDVTLLINYLLNGVWAD